MCIRDSTATEIAADIGSAWQSEIPPPTLKLTLTAEGRQTLDEAEAKKELSHFGVVIPQGKRVTSVEHAVQAANQIGLPVVLKALGMAHKTEHNAVRLNLKSVPEVEQAASDLFNLSKTLYLEAMVQSAVAELIVGITRDTQFGLVLTIGSGGILVEILKDAMTLIIPADRTQVEKAVLGLKSAPLLAGYRGKPKANLKATVDAIMAIQDFAVSNSASLIELDVNPLLLCADDSYAADALIIINPSKGE